MQEQQLKNVITGELVVSKTLWCLHCNQSFKTKDIQIDDGRQCCPHEGCDGAGIGIDLHERKWWR